MEEKVSKQVETSPTLERRRAKYTVEDVRQLCGGISRSTVMREIRRKRLACYRARRTLRFSEEHIKKYLERVEQGVATLKEGGLTASQIAKRFEAETEEAKDFAYGAAQEIKKQQNR